MNSPIKTIITNKTKQEHTITCIPRRRIVLPANGYCELEGDVFSQLINTRSLDILIGQVVSGIISISFTVDELFNVSKKPGVLVIPAYVRDTLNASKADMLKELGDNLTKANKVTEKEQTKVENSSADEEKQEESATNEDTAQNGEEELNANKSDEDTKLEELKLDKVTEKEQTKVEKTESQAAEKKAQGTDKPKTVKKVQVK